MVEVFLNNTIEKIEGEYHQSKNLDSPIALVLHHHPQYGGNMESKMVHTVFSSFVNNHFSVLKINFRGVGKSTGTFDKGMGELVDAAIAIDWLQEHNSNNVPIWVAGFSLGAWVAMQLTMRRPEIVGFIAISPPLTNYDFSFLSPCPVPGLVIQGSHDISSDQGDTLPLVKRLASTAKVDHMQHHIINHGNHFLRNKEEEVGEIISNYIQSRSDLQNGYHSSDLQNGYHSIELKEEEYV